MRRRADMWCSRTGPMLACGGSEGGGGSTGIDASIAAASCCAGGVLDAGNSGGAGAATEAASVAVTDDDDVVRVTVGWLVGGWGLVVGNVGGEVYLGCDRGWKKDRIDGWARDVLAAGSMVNPGGEMFRFFLLLSSSDVEWKERRGGSQGRK